MAVAPASGVRAGLVHPASQRQASDALEARGDRVVGLDAVAVHDAGVAESRVDMRHGRDGFCDIVSEVVVPDLGPVNPAGAAQGGHVRAVHAADAAEGQRGCGLGGHATRSRVRGDVGGRCAGVDRVLLGDQVAVVCRVEHQRIQALVVPEHEHAALVFVARVDVLVAPENVCVIAGSPELEAVVPVVVEAGNQAAGIARILEVDGKRPAVDRSVEELDQGPTVLAVENDRSAAAKVGRGADQRLAVHIAEVIVVAVAEHEVHGLR